MEMQDAAENLSLEARSNAFSSSSFLVASDIRTSLAPAQEVVPRTLFSSLNSSMSKVRSAISSARRDTNQTPRFGGFSREHASEETDQSSPFMEEPSQVPSEFTGTASSVSITKKRKASATLLGLVFVEEPQSICGAPIGNSGRFCLLDKSVCDIDSHRKKGSELRALPLSCWVIVSESPSKPSAYYSPYVTKEDMEKNAHFKTLLSEKMELSQWTRIMMAVTGSSNVNEDEKVPLQSRDMDLGAATPYKRVSFPQLELPAASSEEWALQDKNRWTQLSEELSGIKNCMILIQSQLGVDPGISDCEISSAWEGIKVVSDQIQDAEYALLKQNLSIEAISADTANLASTVHQMELLAYPSVEDLTKLGSSLRSRMDLQKQGIFTELDLTLTPVMQQLQSTTAQLTADVKVLKQNPAGPPVAVLHGSNMSTIALEKKTHDKD